ncbi:MAG: hypothetical protein CMB64_07105 [Euryarchaeota archaeon]|nr:hypothetical protein [Euryarchaeota archaeon]
MNLDRDVLLLDGECGLCNQAAIFINKRISKQKKIDYLSIKSEEAQELISKLSKKQRDADSLYLIRNGKTYIRSAAGIRILLYLKWYYALWYPFCWLFPLPLRDIIYRIVAKNRHKIFKKPEVCLFD